MRRMILIPFLIVIVLMSIVGGVAYYIYNSYMYYTTDDAQVNGSILSVNATTSGKLSALSVQLGNKVHAGDTLATITPAQGGNAVKVTSPIDGTIVQVSGVQNQDVAPGLPLLQVTDLNAVNITAYVDENAIDNVKPDQEVDIHVDAYSGTSFTGKVQRIVDATAGSFSVLPTEDNASGNFTKVSQRIPVVIQISGNTGKDVMPGMSAEVTIHIH